MSRIENISFLLQYVLRVCSDFNFVEVGILFYFNWMKNYDEYLKSMRNTKLHQLQMFASLNAEVKVL